MNYKGNLIVKAGVDYSHVTSIGGSLDCRAADTKTAFPKLTSIGSYLNCWGAGTKTAFPKLTSIGGSLDCEGADTKTAFPKLKKTNDPECPAKDRSEKALFRSFLSSGFIFADNILAKLISQRKSGSTVVLKVVIAGNIETSYVIEKNGVYSHGKTIKEAKASLIFKVSDRDTTRFKTWKLDTKITAADAIASYRAITGACEFGVKNFCEGKDLNRKYTPKEIIKLTADAYGNQTYSDFFEEMQNG